MKKLFKKRQKSRRLLLQGLYSLEISKNNIPNIEKYLLNLINNNKIDTHYFSLLLNNIPIKQLLLNKFINKHIKKNLTSINLIELIILKIATFELIFCKKIPYKVIINEALELSKLFSSKLSYTFINKNLDILAKKIRHTPENINIKTFNLKNNSI